MDHLRTGVRFPPPPLCNQFEPADASAAWIDLYARLTALETELRQHIYLEDNILFARAVGPRE